VITGVSAAEQIRANAQAAEWHLTGEDLAELEALLSS